MTPPDPDGPDGPDGRAASTGADESVDAAEDDPDEGEADDLSALLSSSVLVLLGVGLSSVATLAERVVIGRAFGLDVYGEVSLALAVMTVAVSVSMIGLNHGVPRYMSRFDDPADVRGVWLTGLGFSVGVGLAFAVALWFSVDSVVGLLFEGAAATDLLRAFVVAIPVVVGLHAGVSALRGMENTRYKLYAKDLTYPGVRLVVLLALVHAGVGVVAAGYAYVVAGAVTLVLAHLLARRLFPLVGPTRLHVRSLLAFSAPLVVSMLLAVLLTRTDTLMLGYFRSSAEVGEYGAAYPLANSLLLVINSFGYLYLPLASRLDADGHRDRLTRVYRVTTKWSYVLTFPAFLAMVAFPDDVLRAVFSAEFVGGAPALALLSVGFFTSAALGRNRETLSALGHTNLILAADTAAYLTNLVLNVALIPPYGIVGAAAASALAFGVRNLAISGVLAAKFGIDPIAPTVVRTYLALPVALLPPALLTARFVSLSMLAIPAFLVLAGVATVAVVALAGGLDEADLVALEFVEEAVGMRVPVLRRFIPESEGRIAGVEAD